VFNSNTTLLCSITNIQNHTTAVFLYEKHAHLVWWVVFTYWYNQTWHWHIPF